MHVSAFIALALAAATPVLSVQIGNGHMKNTCKYMSERPDSKHDTKKNPPPRYIIYECDSPKGKICTEIDLSECMAMIGPELGFMRDGSHTLYSPYAPNCDDCKWTGNQKGMVLNCNCIQGGPVAGNPWTGAKPKNRSQILLGDWLANRNGYVTGTTSKCKSLDAFCNGGNKRSNEGIPFELLGSSSDVSDEDGIEDGVEGEGEVEVESEGEGEGEAEDEIEGEADLLEILN